VLEGAAPTEKDFFGLAKILLQSELPPPSPKKEAETQVVFGRFAPVVQDNGPSTGVKVLLSEDGKKVTIISPDATSATYLRADLMKSPLQAGGVTITIALAGGLACAAFWILSPRLRGLRLSHYR